MKLIYYEPKIIITFIILLKIIMKCETQNDITQLRDTCSCSFEPIWPASSYLVAVGEWVNTLKN